jgi:hypothetical protein
MGKLKSVAVGLYLGIAAIGLTSISAQAGPLPVLIDFTGDTAGMSPALGGANQPTAIFNPAGTTVLGQSSANGLATKPLEVTVPAASTFTGWRYNFDTPVSSQIVRVESTFSMNRLFDGIFFQTGTSAGPLINQLFARANGDIIAPEFFGTGASGPVVGTYAANSPFRIRMDIDVGAGSWSFTVDDELNGFLDDTTLTGLNFVNDPMIISDVGALFGTISAAPTLAFDFPVSVAYDDISATALGV